MSQDKPVLTAEQVKALRPSEYGVYQHRTTILTDTFRVLCDLALSALGRHGSGWISVEERLPEFSNSVPYEKCSDDVLVHWPNGHIGIGIYWEKSGWYWVTQDASSAADADPTHWMPLPPAPQAQDAQTGEVTPKPMQVTVKDFLRAASKQPDMTGIQVIFAEWPTR